MELHLIAVCGINFAYDDLLANLRSFWIKFKMVRNLIFLSELLVIYSGNIGKTDFCRSAKRTLEVLEFKVDYRAQVNKQVIIHES